MTNEELKAALMAESERAEIIARECEQQKVIISTWEDIAEDYLEACQEAERRFNNMLQAEHSLSDAYLRLRKKLKAFNTPFAPTTEEVWSHTESKLDQLISERDELCKQVNEMKGR